MQYLGKWIFVVVVSLVGAGVLADERTAKKVAEDIARSGSVDDAIYSLGVLTGLLQNELDLVYQGTSTIDNFAGMIGDAGSILAGDALVLGRIQWMIENDIAILNASNKYDNTPANLPVPDARKIESPNADLAMSEYARVEDVAQSKIDRIEVELGKLASEEERMQSILEGSITATDNGVKLERVFNDLNSKRLGQIGSIDEMWFDMNVVINGNLSQREEAAKNALGRIRERKAFLMDQLTKLSETKEWMETFWWYELLRSKLEETKSEGLDALNEANNAAMATGSAATTGIASEQLKTRIINEHTRVEVSRLLAEAAKADGEAARHVKMMQILGLANAGAKAYKAGTASDTPEQSQTTVINQTTILNIQTQNPLPVDPGNGVPIGTGDLTMPDLSKLPNNLQQMQQTFSEKYQMQ